MVKIDLYNTTITQKLHIWCVVSRYILHRLIRMYIYVWIGIFIYIYIYIDTFKMLIWNIQTSSSLTHIFITKGQTQCVMHTFSLFSLSHDVYVTAWIIKVMMGHNMWSIFHDRKVQLYHTRFSAYLRVINSPVYHFGHIRFPYIKQSSREIFKYVYFMAYVSAMLSYMMLRWDAMQYDAIRCFIIMLHEVGCFCP